jgi:hypothetical protein
MVGRVFSTDLIILKGQRIDVILGTSWMKLHRAVLDIAGRSVHLDSPVYGKVILYVIPHSEIAGMKPPYVCPGCFIHTYSNNMINKFHVQ